MWSPLVSHTVGTMTPPVRTAFRLRPLLLYRPRSQLTPSFANRLQRLQMEQPFPPPPPVAATAPPRLPSLSHCEPPPRSPSEPPDTAPSSAPMPGAPSTSLPPPSATPLLHRCHSPPLNLHRCGTPRSGEPSPLFGRQTGLAPCRFGLRPLHRRPPAAGRSDFVGKSPVLTGEKASPVSSRAKRLRWAEPLQSGWAEHCRGSPNEQCCLLLFPLN
jgi:hypothetical protein